MPNTARTVRIAPPVRRPVAPPVPAPAPAPVPDADVRALLASLAPQADFQPIAVDPQAPHRPGLGWAADCPGRAVTAAGPDIRWTTDDGATIRLTARRR